MEIRRYAALQRLTGRVAVLTGVAGPLGRAVAWRCAAEGARLLLADPDGAAGEEILAEVRQAGATAHFVPFDGSAEADARRITHAALQRFGRVDTLVHNVTLHPEPCDAPDDPPSAGRTDGGLDVDIGGLFAMVFACASAMRLQAEGSMVLTVFARHDAPGRLASLGQATTTAGFGGFVHAAATELYAHGIAVNGVELNDLCEDARSRRRRSAELNFLNAYRKASRFEDVARTACFLGSSEARGLTGQVLVVSGGHAPAPPRYVLSGEDRQRIEAVYRRLFEEAILDA